MKCIEHEVAEDDECAQCELDLGVANTRADANFLLKLGAMIAKLGESKDGEEAEMLDHVVFRLHAIANELEAIADDDEGHPPLPQRQAHEPGGYVQ